MDDNKNSMEQTQVVVIGAGPAGVLAATLLHRQGHQVLVLERQAFPRFSIGESLLPQCMSFLAEAGLLEVVDQAGFQYKDGAAFRHRGRYTDFLFTDKVSAGPGTTFQVQRARFDALLAEGAQAQGVEIRFRHAITAVDFGEDKANIQALDEQGRPYAIQADFVLDASGFGRVLPRLLDLERPSGFPSRQSLFTHVRDHIDCPDHDRNKILISVHPEHRDVWYWLIPFSDGSCSLGVVAEESFFAARGEADNQAKLQALVAEEPDLARLLKNAEYPNPVNAIQGYSAKVSRLYGERFALLGNAGEFLDPVFSSGVTIAFKSASLAAKALDRQLRGEAVDWQGEFAAPLQLGVDVFRTYVQGWYEGGFQDVIFYADQQPAIKQMICAILAGYAWDGDNPFVAQPQRRLKVLTELCRAG
ncbi:NAD(P)/FAD-dependent oxidoreductase [Gallaecimonas sp. GXIMD4217]|uniref:NAD(P)/FAD-dependent oxidoreductase n=1 Tax=Gallaecimonas sp. GXIMD4217 TaxID=3131927 RepID=UPI00311AE7FC